MQMLSKMIFLGVLGSVAVAPGADQFQPQPAAAYPARQTVENVTIGAETYPSGDKVKKAFGKTDPNKWGVLPVLVVLANDSDRILRTDRMSVRLLTPDGQRIEPVPADEVRRPVSRPTLDRGPTRIPGGRIGRKEPRTSEIIEREFVARMVPPRASAHGFFYFRVGGARDRVPGSKLYITGIRDARTGQELFYFEINLN